MDSFFYSLVLVPALTELSALDPDSRETANIGYYAAFFSRFS